PGKTARTRKASKNWPSDLIRGVAARRARRHIRIRNRLEEDAVGGCHPTWPREEGGLPAELLDVARIEVVPEANVDSQILPHLPVVLNVGPHLQVAPSTVVGRQLRRSVGDEPGIDTRDLCVEIGRASCRERG